MNSAYSNQSSCQISALTNNIDFLDQICPKMVFPVKQRKISLLRVSMDCIKLFCMGADRQQDSVSSLSRRDNNEKTLQWCYNAIASERFRLSGELR